MCNHACPSNQICYPVSMISVTLWSITHKRSTYASIIPAGSKLSLTVWSLAGFICQSVCQTSLGALETVLIMFYCALPCAGLIQLLEINSSSAVVSSGIMQTMTHPSIGNYRNQRSFLRGHLVRWSHTVRCPPDCKNSSSFFVICKNCLGVNNLV